MYAVFIDQFGYATDQREATAADVKRWNQGINDQGLEEYGLWVLDLSKPFCPDCGKVGEIKGHMGCAYPS